MNKTIFKQYTEMIKLKHENDMCFDSGDYYICVGIGMIIETLLEIKEKLNEPTLP